MFLKFPDSTALHCIGEESSDKKILINKFELIEEKVNVFFKHKKHLLQFG